MPLSDLSFFVLLGRFSTGIFFFACGEIGARSYCFASRPSVGFGHPSHRAAPGLLCYSVASAVRLQFGSLWCWASFFCFFLCDSYAIFVGRDLTVWLIVPRGGAGYPPLRADPDGYATGKLRLCAYSVVHWRLLPTDQRWAFFSRRRQRSS